MDRLGDILRSCFTYGTMTFGVFLMVPFKMSKKLHEAYFARFAFPIIMYLYGERTNEVRRKAVSQLTGLVSHDAILKKEGAIRVLEIGAGFGANFAYMQRKVKYWNVDPNAEFDDGFRKNMEKYPNVEMENWVHEYAEDMRGVPDGHFDVVLITYVLCSVTEMGKALAECRRVLSKVCTWCLLIASGQTSSSSPIGYRADIAHLQLLHVANIYSAPFTGTMTSEELQEAAPPLPIKETQAAAGVSGHGNPAVMMSPNVPLLMQGGRLVFLEHVAHPEGTWGFFVQTLLDPMWSFSFCGCHVKRRPERLLKAAGFDQIELTKVHLSIPTVLSPQVYVSAVVVKA